MKRVRVELEDGDGYVYVLPSLVYAREYLCISRSTMEAVINRNIRVGGFLVRTSERTETNEGELPRLSGGDIEKRRLRQEVVAWREDMAVKFPSVSQAARIAGCREVTIRQAVRRDARAGGWTWTHAENFTKDCEDWYPGMPITFRFKRNVRPDGTVAGQREKVVEDDSRSLEQKEWEKAGVKTAQEWRDYLWSLAWEMDNYTPPLAEETEDDYGIFR